MRQRRTLSPEVYNPGAPGRRVVRTARERLQSRALVVVVATLLAAGCVDLLPVASRGGQNKSLWLVALAVSLTFSVVVWALRAATPAAAFVGSAVSLLLAVYPRTEPHGLVHSGLFPLAVLFALTYLATRLGRERKQALNLAEPRHGRSAAQVIANLGAAGLLAASAGGHESLAGVLIVAALAEATADTLSSEIGQAFGGTPWLITQGRQVARGTDGGVTPLGTAAGIVGAVAVVLAGAFALRLHWISAALALIAAIAGLFFDSLLGATLERRGWLNNDLVNFLSTIFAAGCAALLMRLG